MRNKRALLVSGTAAAVVLMAAVYAFAAPPTPRVLAKSCLFQLWTEQIRCDASVGRGGVTIEVKNFEMPTTHPYYVAGGRQEVGEATLTLNGTEYPLTETASGFAVTVPAREWNESFSARLVVNDTDGGLILEDSVDWEADQP